MNIAVVGLTDQQSYLKIPITFRLLHQNHFLYRDVLHEESIAWKKKLIISNVQNLCPIAEQYLTSTNLAN